MAQQIIGIGAAANDGTGDPLRTAMSKTKDNFAELYASQVLAGGAIGQVLQKTTAADNAFAWQHVSFNRYPLVSGRYYPMYPRINFAGNATAVASTIYYTPLFLPAPTTIDRIAMRTGTSNAVASNALMGIYADSAGAPGALLFTVNAAAVAVPATATTNIVVTPDAATITLDAGFYWFAIVFDAASQMVGYGSDGSMAWPFGTTITTAYFSATSQLGSYTEASATLPATATGVASSVSNPAAVYRV